MHFEFLNKEQKEIFIGSQSFSGTDLDKDEEEVGIVYPYDFKEKIENGITTSSIIDLHTNDNRLLKHTETRLCNTIDNEQIQYEKLNTVAIVIDDNDDVSIANKILFGIIDNNDCIKGYVESKNKININDDLLEIIKEYKNFEHTYTLIDSNNITEKRYNIGYYGRNFKSEKRFLYKDYATEKTLFDNIEDTNSIKDENSININDGFEDSIEDIFLIDNETPKEVVEEFNILGEQFFDFNNVSLEEINEFYEYFKDNRKYIKAGLLESFIMDYYGVDCSNEKEIEDFRREVYEVKRETKNIITNYILEKIKQTYGENYEDHKPSIL